MSQIDLKHATIRFKDGYTKSGAVNLMAGYAIGATGIAIDGLPALTVLDNGTRFTIAGDTTFYYIVTHTETAGLTTSITFTPALKAMAADNAVISFGPHTIEVHIAKGNLTYDEKRPMEYLTDKGKIDTVREADEEPMDVSLDFKWDFVTAAGNTDPPQPVDVIKNIGNAATWVTSATDTCEPYAIDIELDYEPPCSSVKKETITLPDFRYETLSYDPKAGNISVKGKSNAKTAIVTRTTQT